MLKITKSAQKYFLELLSKKEKNICIRISVFIKNNIFKGNVAFCDIKKIKNNDIKLNFKKLNIFIKFNSFNFLKNIKIDVIKKKLSKKLKFIVLHKKNIIIKKNTLNLKKNINNFLKNIINPKLLNHGGFVLLKNITINNILLIEFHGGCQGCSMSNYTLQNWIQKEILCNFPEIKEVHDVTLHKKNELSYY
ncbi:Fe-S biogenesis protein NfuA [Enterobacteriaceae endosymbiont of Donacia cinerea]|uniref:NifU family protein n=1 Tax=Enterobacteriaceae endosymbiont of Donacia cinerea TaxID=2675774 RepID=UPI001449E6D0|nr:NifU family protein [Enterobacteriaceae endosymbiont of Donacia cinerea]QJC34108.1 Fe-S biogenesis protein NfuA [Enterobacteriaceae endosymbiont of Donacia cinerea]